MVKRVFLRQTVFMIEIWNIFVGFTRKLPNTNHINLPRYNAAALIWQLPSSIFVTKFSLNAETCLITSFYFSMKSKIMFFNIILFLTSVRYAQLSNRFHITTIRCKNYTNTDRRHIRSSQNLWRDDSYRVECRHCTRKEKSLTRISLASRYFCS